MRGRLAALWPVALLVVAPLIAWWPVTRGAVLLGGGDALVMFLPLRVFAVDAWRAGELPLWNEWVFSGFPLLGAMTAGALAPQLLPFFVLPPGLALNWAGLLTLSLCGVTTFAYARAIGCTRAGALLAGLTFAGSGFLVARLANTPILHAAPWLPLLLLALERLRTRAALRWVGAGAVSVALAIFAGHPQVPVYSVGVAAAYVAWGLTSAPPVGRGRFLLLGGLTLGGGLLLAAPQLLPTAELTRYSLRDHLPFDAFVESALPPSSLATLVAPLLEAAGQDRFDVGYISQLEQAGYTGVAALTLALAALAGWRRTPHVAFWALVAVAALLMVLGDATPLARLAYHVPVYNLFRICVRNFFQFDLAVAVLAGLGLSAVQRGVGGRALGLAVLAVGAALLVVVVAVHAPLPARLLPLAVGGTVLLLLLALARRPAPPLVALLVALQGLDLFLYAHGVQQQFPLMAEAEVTPPWLAPLRAVAGEQRAVQAAAGDVIPADYRPALAGQRLIQGYDSLIMRRYALFAGDMDYAGRIPEAELVGAPLFLDLLGTRAAVVAFRDEVQGQVALGGTRFAYPALATTLAPGESISFTLPAARRVQAVAVVSFLGGAVGVGQGEVVARITVRDAAGGAQSAALLAGVHTAEWAWERPDVAATVRHRRAPVAEVFPMPDGADGRGNKYVGTLALPQAVAAVRVEVQSVTSATLQLARLALLDADGTPTPLSLAHLLLERPQRWARRASVVEAPRPLAASPLLAGDLLRGLYAAAPAAPPLGELQVEVLENRLALPPAWFVPRTLATDEWGALASVRTGRLPDGAPFEPRAVALVENAPGRDFGPADPAASAVVTARAAQRLLLETHSATPGFLVVGEIFYPGWTATVDGAPASILRTNGVLRGLALPAGTHRVEFTYRPLSVRLGFALAGVAVLAFAAAALWRRARRRVVPIRIPSP